MDGDSGRGTDPVADVGRPVHELPQPLPAEHDLLTRLPDDVGARPVAVHEPTPDDPAAYLVTSVVPGEVPRDMRFAVRRDATHRRGYGTELIQEALAYALRFTPQAALLDLLFLGSTSGLDLARPGHGAPI